MTMFTRPVAMTLARAFAIPALLSATLLGGIALTSHAFAQTAATSTADAKIEARADTIEQRIASLHGSLKITPAEEANWTPVAQTMRDNAADMEKLVVAKKAQSPANMTALDDLMNYQTFAQAHVDGLKKLNATFKSL